ncbi:MAG: hypothetical protein Q7R48_01910 [bacterium]|nr:hypothetical protein [bacterium]
MKTLQFFFGEFHSGAMNHATHFVGFTLLGYGLARQNWGVVLLSACVMESGHVYNYASGKYRSDALRMSALGLAVLIFFAAAVYLLMAPQ